MVIMVGDAQWTGFAKASGRAWIVSWPMTTPAEADAVQRLLDKMDTNRQLTMTVNGVQHSLDLSGFATMNPDFVQGCFARFLTFRGQSPAKLIAHLMSAGHPCVTPDEPPRDAGRSLRPDRPRVPCTILRRDRHSFAIGNFSG